jgi:hypothetical protein
MFEDLDETARQGRVVFFFFFFFFFIYIYSPVTTFGFFILFLGILISDVLVCSAL